MNARTMLPKDCTLTDAEAIALAREVATSEHHPGDWSDCLTSVRTIACAMPGHQWTEKSVTMLRSEHGSVTISVVSIQGAGDWETFDALHIRAGEVAGVADVCARFLAQG